MVSDIYYEHAIFFLFFFTFGCDLNMPSLIIAICLNYSYQFISGARICVNLRQKRERILKPTAKINVK